ncbi:MAG: DM13 domain-containing protein [Dehalococcoidia bacterium]
MKNLLSRVPWFVGMPVFVGAVVVAAFVSNYLGADYFKRTRLDEANPLALAEAGEPDAKAAQQGLVVARGTFRDGEPGHHGEGTAQVIQDSTGNLLLRLEAFSVTNGPDLFVVLSSEPDKYEASGALDLGGLKATDGNFNYEIPAGTPLNDFKSVIIWCRQFDVTFAVAALEVDSGLAADSIATVSPASGAATPAAQAATPAATPPGPKVVASGTFKDGAPGHHGSGTVTLGFDAAGKAFLVFEDFSVTNGPDLHVILGNSPGGSGEGLDLGELKATDGNFSYAVPDGADLSQYTSVTIWCASFPTVFAVATLGA